MAWWMILLIVLGSIAGALLLLFGVLFIVYFFNLDTKLIVKVMHPLLLRHYDKLKKDRNI